MELATGAMGALLPKLVAILKGEYNLQAGLRKDIDFLEREMRSMDAALRKVATVWRDQLNEHVKIWADDVRELSYEMEDVVDRFLVCVEGPAPAPDSDSFRGFVKKVISLFKKRKTHHHIVDAIKDIKDQVHEVASRRDRYKIDDVGGNPVTTTTIDPRMLALFKDKRDIIGIDEPRDELIKRLANKDDSVEQALKILSIFGFGGLGKTTLAKAVYDKLQGFACRAFVPVGQDPDVKKVLMDILLQLDEGCFAIVTMLDEWQLIRKLRGLLDNKRYLIVIDDIWSVKSWEIIRCAWVDNSCGSVIIITTRILEVAEETGGHIYKHKPLSSESLRELFNKRLSVGKGKHSYDQSVEIAEKVLQKCGGVPLAIITIASLLAGKPREDWSEVYNSVGFGHGNSIHVDNTRKILLFSYYDLPSNLRTCLLHLTIFSEDSEIEKDALIWKWIAEGFICEDNEMGLFASGERCFNELINRSMIQPIELPYQDTVYACRVHDLVLDMIISLSREENFVTTFYGKEQCNFPQRQARRLAIIQKRVSQQQQQQQIRNLANIHMAHVRSFIATTCHLCTMPSLSSFQAVRVLALEGCTFKDDHPYDLENLRRLLQLRYLGLSDTPITNLPAEIGDLMFLQTLNLSATEIKELPLSITRLGQMKCLRFDGPVSPWIVKVTSLEELSFVNISRSSLRHLGKLTELRELNANFEDFDDESLKDLMDSVGNMQRLHALEIDSRHSWKIGLSVKWVECQSYIPPRDLRRMTLYGVVFPMLPTWIDSSRLPHLTHLRLRLKVVETRGMEILGRFPELVTLNLSNGHHDGMEPADPVIASGAFPMLRYLSTNVKLMFQSGAMPSLECVFYWLKTPQDVHQTYTSIENLPSLQEVTVYVKCASDSAFFKEAKAAFKDALKDHPNKPASYLSTF